jgi:hypothetical protein
MSSGYYRVAYLTRALTTRWLLHRPRLLCCCCCCCCREVLENGSQAIHILVSRQMVSCLQTSVSNRNVNFSSTPSSGAPRENRCCSSRVCGVRPRPLKPAAASQSHVREQCSPPVAASIDAWIMRTTQTLGRSPSAEPDVIEHVSGRTHSISNHLYVTSRTRDHTGGVSDAMSDSEMNRGAHSFAFRTTKPRSLSP